MHVKTVIIGAGIAGPAAALAFAGAGHDVTVIERRPRNDLWADSTVAITTDNMKRLAAYGVEVPHLPAGSLALNAEVGDDLTTTVSDWTTKFNIVVWGALHEAIVETAEKHGATFLWRQNGGGEDVPAADLMIHAQGVRYAVHHSQFSYAYMVYRGTLFGDADPYWLSLHSARKDFVLNIGSTGTQRTWMLYLHEPAPEDYSTALVTGVRREKLMLRAEMIPAQWRNIITSTRSEIQV